MGNETRDIKELRRELQTRNRRPAFMFEDTFSVKLWFSFGQSSLLFSDSLALHLMCYLTIFNIVWSFYPFLY